MLLYFALIAGCFGSLFIAWQSIKPRTWVTYLSLVCILLGAAGTIWLTSDSDKSTKDIRDKSDKIADNQIKLEQQNEKLSLQNKELVDSVTGGDYHGSFRVVVIGHENLVEISYINEGKFTLYDATLEIEDLDITNEILQPAFDKITTSKSQSRLMTAFYNAKAKATSVIEIGNLAPGRGKRTVWSLPETASRHYVIYARARNGQTTLNLTLKRVGRTWKSAWTEYQNGQNGKITRQGAD